MLTFRQARAELNGPYDNGRGAARRTVQQTLKDLDLRHRTTLRRLGAVLGALPSRDEVEERGQRWNPVQLAAAGRTALMEVGLDEPTVASIALSEIDPAEVTVPPHPSVLRMAEILVAAREVSRRFYETQGAICD